MKIGKIFKIGEKSLFYSMLKIENIRHVSNKNVFENTQIFSYSWGPGSHSFEPISKSKPPF